MAAQPREFNIVSDGWCLYNAYLTVFTTNHAWYTPSGMPLAEFQRERTRSAIEFATRLASLATDDDKQYITQRLTSGDYDGIEIMNATGVRTGRYGYPSQLRAADGEEFIEVSGSRQKFITTADEYLRAMHTPIIDTRGNTQPEAWGSISLLRPLIIRFRPDIYFDVRVRDATGEADANAGRALLGQEPMKYLGPNGEKNMSLINVGNHYNSRVYVAINENPVPINEEDELMAATLGSLLIGSAGTALESEKEAPAIRPGATTRIQRLASALPPIIEETGPNLEAEKDASYVPRTPVRNSTTSVGARPVAYNRSLNATRALAAASIAGIKEIPAAGSSSWRRRGEPPIENSMGVEMQPIAAEPVRRGTYERIIPSEELARSSRVNRRGPGRLSRFAAAVGDVGRRAAAAAAATVPEPGGVEYVPQPLPSVSGLFPRISMPTFDSTAIPQPRHRKRHPYRRFVAPPAPPAPIVAAPSPRSTEIPAWASQHITQANVAANVKGVAATVAEDVLAMQDYRGVNADSAYAAYKADPKTRGLDSSGGDPVHWDELVDRYPDRSVLIRDGSGDLHKFRVSNPYRAAAYRRKPTFTFGDPTGLNPQQSVMAQQNMDVLMEIAPEEMIADTKYATALLESLWYCGAAKDIGADPRCFPARVLGELREYKMYKDERARAALAAKARQYSEWEFIKGVLRKVRGQLSGSDRAAGPVVISGIPDVAEPAVGQNLSAAASAQAAVAGLAARSAAVGPTEEASRIIPEAGAPPAASAATPKKNTGPAPRRKLPSVARVALAEPPRTLGAIGLRPMPPPAVLGAWGSRFRPIIPGI